MAINRAKLTKRSSSCFLTHFLASKCRYESNSISLLMFQSALCSAHTRAASPSGSNPYGRNFAGAWQRLWSLSGNKQPCLPGWTHSYSRECRDDAGQAMAMASISETEEPSTCEGSRNISRGIEPRQVRLFTGRPNAPYPAPCRAAGCQDLLPLGAVIQQERAAGAGPPWRHAQRLWPIRRNSLPRSAGRGIQVVSQPNSGARLRPLPGRPAG